MRGRGVGVRVAGGYATSRGRRARDDDVEDVSEDAPSPWLRDFNCHWALAACNCKEGEWQALEPSLLFLSLPEPVWISDRTDYLTRR